MIPLTNPYGAQALRAETSADDSVARVVLRGEADFSTLGELDEALEAVEHEGARAIQLVVGELHFADAATIRRLTAFAREARRTGRDVTTVGANHAIRRVIGLLHAEDDLGLT
ncbi:anti-anti-sigma factor [Marmoricola sp. URHA0025 HA25]